MNFIKMYVTRNVSFEVSKGTLDVGQYITEFGAWAIVQQLI